MRIYRKDSSIRGNVLRELMSDVTAIKSIGKKIKTGAMRANPIEPEWKCPKGYVWDKIDREQYVLEVQYPKENRNHLWILQLHGGGYIGPMKNAYRNFGIKYSEHNGGCSVVTPDYRVAPKHPFPAALQDCVDAYQWILEHGVKEEQIDKHPHNLVRQQEMDVWMDAYQWILEHGVKEEQIVLVGDSAGGGLVFALGLWLKEQGKSMPKGMITMSAWTDVSCSGSSYKTNFQKDPLFGNTKESMLYRKDYIREQDPKNPLLSPLFGDLSGFPPIHMQVGSYEMLLSDTEEFAKKASEAKVSVEVVIFEKMFHVFPMAGNLIPETQEAWKYIETFLNRIYEKAPSSLQMGGEGEQNHPIKS